MAAWGVDTRSEGANRPSISWINSSSLLDSNLSKYHAFPIHVQIAFRLDTSLKIAFALPPKEALGYNFEDNLA